MTREPLASLTVADLVERYVAAGIEGDEAEKHDDQSKLNRSVLEMFAIAKELKSRPGDQRHALLALHSHPNLEVRLKAAKATLAIAPIEARKVIEWIAASNWFPYAGDAGMCLYMLDSGKYVPD